MEEEKKGRRCDNGNFFHLLSFQITNSLLFLHMWEERGPQFRLFISQCLGGKGADCNQGKKYLGLPSFSYKKGGEESEVDERVFLWPTKKKEVVQLFGPQIKGKRKSKGLFYVKNNFGSSCTLKIKHQNNFRRSLLSFWHD